MTTDFSDAVKGRKIGIAYTKGDENTSYRSSVKSKVDFPVLGSGKIAIRALNEALTQRTR